MMRRWVRRTAALHRELRALAPVREIDPRWWLVAGGAALPWRERALYLASDADPNGDTFIGYRSDARPYAADAIAADAVARAYAARAAIRTLDGELPDQPLAVTISRSSQASTLAPGGGAILVPSALDVAAFAVGDECWCATLTDTAEHRACLVDELVAVLAGHAPGAAGAEGADVAEGEGRAGGVLRPLGTTAVPFVCVSLGSEPIETARHGHRRAWVANGVATGPWLGLGRARDVASGDDLETVSTCHLVIDGYGHARLCALLAAHRTAGEPWLGGYRTREMPGDRTMAGSRTRSHRPTPDAFIGAPRPVIGQAPLGVAWREVERTPRLRAVPLAYALGQLLHELSGGAPDGFSPTFQIPVAPGALDDPQRKKRRVIPALASVRFSDGEPEPYEAFAERVGEMLVREAQGDGLAAQLLAAARGAPAPLAWKRRAVGGGGGPRPAFLAPLAEVIGGRGCVSRIRVDHPLPPACAVSAPARLATADDPLGACVVTVVDDGESAAITLCGTGAAGTSADAAVLLDRLLALLPDDP